MKRRAFLISTGGVAAGMLVLPQLAFAEANRIDWYTSSDQNIIDFWTNIVKPKFEAANPGVTLNLVDGGDSAGLQAIAEPRRWRRSHSKADPQADFFEGFDARLPAGALEAGLYVDFTKENLSNYSKINPLADRHPDQNMPYRGSQVLLAYDTTKLPADKAPKTWADLVAWIKANPGQFIYNRPDKGGSGGNFVAPRHLRSQRQGPVGVQGRQLHGRRPASAMLQKGLGHPQGPRPVADGPGRLHLGQHPVDPAARARAP